MTIENAKNLVSRCSTDPATREKIEAAGVEGFAAASEALGLACTVADFEEALAAAMDSSDDLSDEQLSNVSGGKIAKSDVPDNMLSLLTSQKATGY